jgi:hypothetical protein
MWHNFIEIYKLILTILSILFLMLTKSSRRQLLYTMIILTQFYGVTIDGVLDW